jgi:hypothetical protein
MYECLYGFVSTCYLLLPATYYCLQIPAVCQQFSEYITGGGSLFSQFLVLAACNASEDFELETSLAISFPSARIT